ncbi:hypothetical protein PFISCL1PPCAC_5506, partial [Pristionchus fissidentatus]
PHKFARLTIGGLMEEPEQSKDLEDWIKKEEDERSDPAQEMELDMEFDGDDAESIRDEQEEFNRLRSELGDNQFIVVTSDQGKLPNINHQVILHPRGAMEGPIGYRKTGSEVKKWDWKKSDQAAEILIDNDPTSVQYQVIRRRALDKLIMEEKKTMGRDALDRLRYYTKHEPKAEHLTKVKQIFEEKKAKYDEYVKCSGLKAWGSAFTPSSSTKSVMKKPLEFCIDGFNELGGEILSANHRYRYRKPHYVDIRSCNIMPRQHNYTKIQMSFLSEDSHTLSHIPFVDDRNIDESAFTRELMQLYDEGIHGTRETYKPGMNDRILFEMLSDISWITAST